MKLGFFALSAFLLAISVCPAQLVVQPDTGEAAGFGSPFTEPGKIDYLTLIGANLIDISKEEFGFSKAQEKAIRDSVQKIGIQNYFAQNSLTDDLEGLTNDEITSRYDEFKTYCAARHEIFGESLANTVTAKQLTQIKKRAVINQMGIEGLFAVANGKVNSSGHLAAFLDKMELSDEQLKELRDKAAEINSELQEKISELRKQAAEKLVDAIPTSSFEKLE